MLYLVRMDVNIPGMPTGGSGRCQIGREGTIAGSAVRRPVAPPLAGRRPVRELLSLRCGWQRRTARNTPGPAPVPLHGHSSHAPGPTPFLPRSIRKITTQFRFDADAESKERTSNVCRN